MQKYQESSGLAWDNATGANIESEMEEDKKEESLYGGVTL